MPTRLTIELVIPHMCYTDNICSTTLRVEFITNRIQSRCTTPPSVTMSTSSNTMHTPSSPGELSKYDDMYNNISLDSDIDDDDATPIKFHFTKTSDMTYAEKCKAMEEAERKESPIVEKEIRRYGIEMVVAAFNAAVDTLESRE